MCEVGRGGKGGGYMCEYVCGLRVHFEYPLLGTAWK